MKKLSFAALLLLLCLPSVAGRVVTDTVKSKILSADVPYNVYLPDGFGNDKGQKYPVIYLLHGLSDDYRAWRDKGRMITSSGSGAVSATGSSSSSSSVTVNRGRCRRLWTNSSLRASASPL